MKTNKPMLIAFIFLATLCAVPWCEAAQGEYIIGEGDLLKITVYDNADLATEARVSGDGKITFPLIGEVAVSDMTAAEVEKKIAKLLSQGYLKKPEVSVFISEYKSRKVTILGEIARPGRVVLRGAYSLMEVISDAGGITQNAGETLYIQRKSLKPGDKKESEDVTLNIDLKKLFEAGDESANVPVLDGDSIYVPKAAFVYVNGEVRSPGAYKITKGLTVLKAITIAGGLTPIAGGSRTKIIRKTEKGETRIKAKMDDLVQPDDIILVPESLF